MNARIRILESKEGDFSPFKVLYLDRKMREVIEDFYFHDKDYGIIKVPAGFKTDFASIGALKNPKLYVMYALLAGYGDMAATVHDYLYFKGARRSVDDVMLVIDRADADRIYYNALRAEGIARWRAWIFYAGVRIGGWFAWNKHKKNGTHVFSSK